MMCTSTVMHKGADSKKISNIDMTEVDKVMSISYTFLSLLYSQVMKRIVMMTFNIYGEQRFFGSYMIDVRCVVV